MSIIEFDPPSTFNTLAPDGKIGVIEVSPDWASMAELPLIFPHSYGLFSTRLALENPLTPESLGKSIQGLPTAAKNILPYSKLDALVYNCTSAATVIGVDKVHGILRQARPEVRVVTDPLTAAIAALNAVKAKKVTVVTPYVKSVNEVMLEKFTEASINVVKIGGFGLGMDEEIAATPVDYIEKCVLSCFDADKSDALFISCTGLFVVGIIEKLEKLIGCPVITSNQAVAWHIMQSLNKTDESRPQVNGYGQLFKHKLL